MMKVGVFVLVVAVAVIAIGYAPIVAGAAGLSARCNSRMIGDYSNEIRDYDAHPPSGNLEDLQKRFNLINGVLQELGQERAVIDSVCPSDADKAPLYAYLSATASYALALESDIAIRINQPCPPAAKAVAQALLAQGWLDLATIVNEAGGTPPKDIADAAPRIQKRAGLLGLTLPAWADTSAYWRDQQANQAKAAVEACSSPPPSASPAAAASPAPSASP